MPETRPSSAFVRSASLKNFVEIACELGLNPYQQLRKFGIDAAALTTPDMRLPAASVCALLESAAETSGCSSFGLRMAEARRLSDFGAISLLIMHQPTLRDVLATLRKYQNMLNEALAVHVEDSGDIALIREEFAADFPGPKSQCFELAVGAMYGLLRTLLGDRWQPVSINFTHPAPRDLSTHRRFLKAPLEFESEFNGIVCLAVDLQKPNGAADPVLAQYAGRFVDTLQPATAASTSNEVKKAIYLLLPVGGASISRVARVLSIQQRTLQRRLTDEGFEFSDLLNGVRRDLAVRYLANPKLSVTQVSETLGYGQLSSFTRWFSAEFGASPIEWRRRSFAASDAEKAIPLQQS